MPSEQFELTEDHIKLLQRGNVVWHEDVHYDKFGAPGLDPKRPYGNSNVPIDMLEILGRITPEQREEYEADGVPIEIVEELRAIHREMRTALQIVLKTTSFESGVYEKASLVDPWKKV